MRSLNIRRSLRLGGSALAVVTLGLWGVALAGTAPDAQTMVYRGQLQQNGAPFTGLVNMSFDFYDAQGNCLEGSSLCAAPAVPVYVLNGEFSVDLALPPAMLQSQSPTIQVTVNGTPLQGSQRIYPVPFAERGRTQGPFVAEEEVDVVNTDAGVTDVAVGGNRSGAANGREIDFLPQSGDDAQAGTITYYPGAQPNLTITGAGTAPNRQVQIADSLSTSRDATIGRNLAVTGTATLGATVTSRATITDATVGNATVSGSLSVGGVTNLGAGGGNVPHQCVVRSTTSGDVAYCASGEIAVGGGADCGVNNAVGISEPACASGSAHGQGCFGSVPTSWYALCEGCGSGCGPYAVSVVCCAY